MKVKVSLIVDYEKDYHVCFDIASDALRAFQPIDTPSDPGNYPWVATLCTSNAEAKKIKYRRDKLERILSKELSRALIKLMSKDDLIDGYEK